MAYAQAEKTAKSKNSLAAADAPKAANAPVSGSGNAQKAQNKPNFVTLEKGTSDRARTLELQRRLNALGYSTNGLDGGYGNGTVGAVKQFQSDRGLSATGIADEQTQAILYSEMPDPALGALAAKYESHGNNAVVGYDSNGGTSYGCIQIASIPGTMGQFVQWLADNGYSDLSNKLKNARPYNTGGNNKSSGCPKVWCDNATALMEPVLKFSKQMFFTDALNNYASKSMKEYIESSKALSEVYMSTSINHGAYGAKQIIKPVYDQLNPTGDTASQISFIRAIYDARKIHVKGNKYEEALVNRYTDECKLAVDLLNVEKSMGTVPPVLTDQARKEQNETAGGLSNQTVDAQKPDVVPESGSAVEEITVQQDIIYTVQSGDSYWAIANKFKVPGGYKALMAYNNAGRNECIYVGQKLKIPSQVTIQKPKEEAPAAPENKPESVQQSEPVQQPEPAQQEPAAKPEKPQEQPKPVQQDITYTVQSGDSFWAIANKFKVPGGYKALMRYNNMTENHMLHPGEQLKIPTGNATVPAVEQTAEPETQNRPPKDDHSEVKDDQAVQTEQSPSDTSLSDACAKDEYTGNAPTARLNHSTKAVKTMQRHLERHGFYSSGIDGKWGKGTSVALMKFQYRTNQMVGNLSAVAHYRSNPTCDAETWNKLRQASPQIVYPAGTPVAFSAGMPLGQVASAPVETNKGVMGYMTPNAAKAMGAMINRVNEIAAGSDSWSVYKPDGVPGIQGLTSTFRGMTDEDTQAFTHGVGGSQGAIELFAQFEYDAGRAAVPGRSNHCAGRAADIDGMSKSENSNLHNWIVNNYQGTFSPYQYEKWHFDYVGG